VLLVGGIIVGVAVLAVILRRPASRYELYTTPPLDPKHVRLSLLVPRGWQARLIRDSGIDSLILAPTDGRDWLPGWLKGVLGLQKSQLMHNGLTINLLPKNFEQYWPSEGDSERQDPDLQFFWAGRYRPIPGIGMLEISYTRDNRQAFKSTSKTNFDSITVL